MGKLEIAGWTSPREPAIRKMWAIKTGAPFQPEYPESFLKDIRDQGIFDNLGKTRAETNIDEKSHVVNVTLYLQRQRRKTEQAPEEEVTPLLS